MGGIAVRGNDVGLIGSRGDNARRLSIVSHLFCSPHIIVQNHGPSRLRVPYSTPPSTSTMRRPVSFQVDAPIHAYDDPQPTTPASMSTISLSPVASTTKFQLSSYKPLEPSLTLLFSLMSRRDILCFFVPAILISLISGGVAPFMTIAVGQAFDAFAKFPLSSPTQQDRDKLLRGVGHSALELLGLAVAALVLSSVTSSLWIATGEKNLRALRRRAYHVITNKEMLWFDKMGSDDSAKPTDGEDGSIGAGGMMAQFVKYVHFCPLFSPKVANAIV